MTRFELRYVQRLRDRHGTVRHYFRRPGCPRALLPGAPGSEAFMEAYKAALAAQKAPIGVSRSKAGTLTALIAAYYSSTEFRQLAVVTRATYRNILERLRSEHGDKPVALMQREHIKRLMAAKAATPATANALLKMLRIIMQFAVEDGWRRDNPATGIKRQRTKGEGWQPWSEPDIARYEARWEPGSRARLALVLLLAVGQRRGDVVRMGRPHVRGGMLDVRQSKTGTSLRIPMLPELVDELERHPTDRMTFLLTAEGKAFTPAGFSNWFRECCRAAGLNRRSAHGLRKASATRLAEAGATIHQLMAIFGWKSIDEAEVYTRSVDQVRLATSAMVLLRPPKRTEPGT